MWFKESRYSTAFHVPCHRFTTPVGGAIEQAFCIAFNREFLPLWMLPHNSDSPAPPQFLPEFVELFLQLDSLDFNPELTLQLSSLLP